MLKILAYLFPLLMIAPMARAIMLDTEFQIRMTEGKWTLCYQGDEDIVCSKPYTQSGASIANALKHLQAVNNAGMLATQVKKLPGRDFDVAEFYQEVNPEKVCHLAQDQLKKAEDEKQAAPLQRLVESLDNCQSVPIPKVEKH